jgi:hypothetical protein
MRVAVRDVELVSYAALHVSAKEYLNHLHVHTSSLQLKWKVKLFVSLSPTP